MLKYTFYYINNVGFIFFFKRYDIKYKSLSWWLFGFGFSSGSLSVIFAGEAILIGLGLSVSTGLLFATGLVIGFAAMLLAYLAVKVVQAQVISHAPPREGHPNSAAGLKATEQPKPLHDLASHFDSTTKASTMTTGSPGLFISPAGAPESNLDNSKATMADIARLDVDLRSVLEKFCEMAIQGTFSCDLRFASMCRDLKLRTYTPNPEGNRRVMKFYKNSDTRNELGLFYGHVGRVRNYSDFMVNGIRFNNTDYSFKTAKQYFALETKTARFVDMRRGTEFDAHYKAGVNIIETTNTILVFNQEAIPSRYQQVLANNPFVSESFADLTRREPTTIRYVGMCLDDLLKDPLIVALDIDPSGHCLTSGFPG